MRKTADVLLEALSSLITARADYQAWSMLPAPIYDDEGRFSLRVAKSSLSELKGTSRLIPDWVKTVDDQETDFIVAHINEFEQFIFNKLLDVLPGHGQLGHLFLQDILLQLGSFSEQFAKIQIFDVTSDTVSFDDMVLFNAYNTQLALDINHLIDLTDTLDDKAKAERHETLANINLADSPFRAKDELMEVFSTLE